MKKHFFTGLLIWIPLAITLWVLHLIVTTMDRSMEFVPADWQPHFYFPGLGLALTLIIVWLTGLLASNILGRRVIQFSESIVHRIPVVNSIYGGVKQVSDTLFRPGGQAFRKVMLIQYPRRGTWTVAFQTGQPTGEVKSRLGEDYVSVYVPTTPNPTSGFFLMVPRSEAIELSMSIDEALKYVISMGSVPPTDPGSKIR
jgi:uncharacterized membrane protein